MYSILGRIRQACMRPYKLSLVQSLKKQCQKKKSDRLCLAEKKWCDTKKCKEKSYFFFIYLNLFPIISLPSVSIVKILSFLPPPQRSPISSLPLLTTMSKEENIQEAIRLVQDCNYSRRKAASSTGISPNTLKRRLNGSIPREEYLERTKKITASEELILENMIISLIQQGEHIKASALRLLVALYIKNKTAPTNVGKNAATAEDLELIPKGWCARFMKRSRNLVVNQGIIEIKDENNASDVLSEPSAPAFANLLKPPTNSEESLADTQKHIVDNASTLIEGFRMDFNSVRLQCTQNETADNGELLNAINAMSTIFNEVSMLASVLNFTSHVSLDQLAKSDDGEKPYNTKTNPAKKNFETDQFTPEYYSPNTPPSPVTPKSPSSCSLKRSASVYDDQQNTAQIKKVCRDKRAMSWTGYCDLSFTDLPKTTVMEVNNNLPLANSPTVTTPFTSMLLNATEIKQEKPNYFSQPHRHSLSTPGTLDDYNGIFSSDNCIAPRVTMFTSSGLTPSIVSSVNLPCSLGNGLSEDDYNLTFSSADLINSLTSTVGSEVDLRMMLGQSAGDPMMAYN